MRPISEVFMKTKEGKVTVHWKITNIGLVSFKVEEKIKSPGEYSSDKINFKLGTNLDVDPARHRVTVDFFADVFSDESLSEKLGSIQTKGEYSIKNFDEVMEKNGNSFPTNILAALVGVSLSTTRGMLILLSKGTVFDSAIIPIVNPMIFFQPQKPETT